MNLLTMKEIVKAHTDKVLFDKADFSINEGEKVGVLGINGTGKSTLLRMIAGLDECDEGQIAMGNGVVIKYLPQNPEFAPEATIYECVVSENETHENHWSIEGDAKNILNKLGFSDYSLKIAHLSGGQKKKVALAAALLAECDILILDEPTNHLDNDMTEWLEEYLISYKGALIMVTHDRYFLDMVCNRIVEIDRGSLYSYKANYEGYLELKAQREEMAYATQRKHQAILKKEILWMQRGARARSTKQKAHIARFEALRDEDLIKEEEQIEISARFSRLGKKTIEVKNISKSFGDRTIIKDFNYIFLRDDRVGIIGPNGCGKSTLLKIIIGILPMDSGDIEIGETVKIGYFAQDNEQLDGSKRVIDYIKETAEYITTSEGTVTASQMCETFLFDSTLQYSLISKLSGGEKRRLYLLKILMESPNVLILDEPTNDLDIQTLCILEDYLDTFPGILITVSHDRYFLDRVAKRLFAFESDGNIQQFEGSYTEYYMQSRPAAGQAADKKDEKDKNIKIKDVKIKFSYKEQREYDIIEEEIGKIEDKIVHLEEQIVQSATDFIKLGELSKEKEKAELLLEEKMERYVFLEEKASRIN